MEGTGLKLSITEGRKEGKRLRLAVSWKRSFRDASKEKEHPWPNSVETSGADERSSTKRPRAKENARRKKFDVRFSLIRQNRVFLKKYMRTGVRKLLRTGFCPRKSMAKTSSWCRGHRKAEVEEANGSSNRKEGVGFALTSHGSEQSGS